MTKIYKSLAVFLIACLFLTACNLPSGGPASQEGTEATPTFTPIPAEALTSTPTATAVPVVQECSPIVTANTDSNVRGGPGQVYNIIGYLPLGGTAPVAGKNFDGTWWYIQFAGSYGWISGSITTATCIPAALAVIAAPPTPVVPPTSTTAPSGPSPTPVPGYTFVFDPGIIIDPGIFFIPTATPTFSIFFPTFEIPCPWWGC